MTYRCPSCGGLYADPQVDGGPYRHVCPPDRVTTGRLEDAGGLQVRAEVRAAIANPRDENAETPRQRAQRRIAV